MALTPVVKMTANCPIDFDIDVFMAAINARLASRSRSFERLIPQDRNVSLFAGFTDAGEGRQFFQWLGARLGHTGGPQGQVIWHLCSHAFGEPATESCDQAPEFTVVV